MKKKYGTIAALSAITAKLAMGATGVGAQEISVRGPMQGDPGGVSGLSRELSSLSDQCDYIWDNRTNAQLLTQELNRILSNSPDSRTCDEPMSPEMRQSCEEQCSGLILALLGGDPVAEVPGDDGPNFPGGPVADTLVNEDPLLLDETEGY